MLFKALKEAATRGSRSNTRRSSAVTTPYESVCSDDSFSSFSDDSDSERRRRARRKAVTKRNPGKLVKQPKASSSSTVITKPKPKAPAKPKQIRKAVKREETPAESPAELVKIAKKEGTTKYQQMRKFLAKANESDKPQDLLAGFLSSRRTHSPTRSSVGSVDSPRGDGFHTGLTPKASCYRLPSPTLVPRRDSEESFAAADLLAMEGSAVEHKLGSFIHGQRSLNLRHRSKAVGAGDNLHLTALLMEEIPDMQTKMEKVSRAELRQRILTNTAEDEQEKENCSLDDSQLGELEIIAGL